MFDTLKISATSFTVSSLLLNLSPGTYPPVSDSLSAPAHLNNTQLHRPIYFIANIFNQL